MIYEEVWNRNNIKEELALGRGIFNLIVNIIMMIMIVQFGILYSLEDIVVVVKNVIRSIMI